MKLQDGVVQVESQPGAGLRFRCRRLDIRISGNLGILGVEIEAECGGQVEAGLELKPYVALHLFQNHPQLRSGLKRVALYGRGLVIFTVFWIVSVCTHQRADFVEAFR
jgi:hypothetical protein